MPRLNNISVSFEPGELAPDDPDTPFCEHALPLISDRLAESIVSVHLPNWPAPAPARSRSRSRAGPTAAAAAAAAAARQLKFQLRVQTDRYIAPALLVLVFINGDYQLSRIVRALVPEHPNDDNNDNDNQPAPPPPVFDPRVNITLHRAETADRKHRGNFTGQNWYLAETAATVAAMTAPAPVQPLPAPPEEPDQDLSSAHGTVDVFVLRCDTPEEAIAYQASYKEFQHANQRTPEEDPARQPATAAGPSHAPVFTTLWDGPWDELPDRLFNVGSKIVTEIRSGKGKERLGEQSTRRGSAEAFEHRDGGRRITDHLDSSAEQPQPKQGRARCSCDKCASLRQERQTAPDAYRERASAKGDSHAPTHHPEPLPEVEFKLGPSYPFSLQTYTPSNVMDTLDHPYARFRFYYLTTPLRRGPQPKSSSASPTKPRPSRESAHKSSHDNLQQPHSYPPGRSVITSAGNKNLKITIPAFLADEPGPVSHRQLEKARLSLKIAVSIVREDEFGTVVGRHREPDSVFLVPLDEVLANEASAQVNISTAGPADGQRSVGPSGCSNHVSDPNPSASGHYEHHPPTEGMHRIDEREEVPDGRPTVSVSLPHYRYAHGEPDGYPGSASAPPCTCTTCPHHPTGQTQGNGHRHGNRHEHGHEHGHAPAASGGTSNSRGAQVQQVQYQSSRRRPSEQISPRTVPVPGGRPGFSIDRGSRRASCVQQQSQSHSQPAPAPADVRGRRRERRSQGGSAATATTAAQRSPSTADSESSFEVPGGFCSSVSNSEEEFEESGPDEGVPVVRVTVPPPGRRRRR